MMQVINQLYKLNCFNCAVGKIIIKNFIAHNEFISAVTAFTMLKMEYKHNRRQRNEH